MHTVNKIITGMCSIAILSGLSIFGYSVYSKYNPTTAPVSSPVYVVNANGGGEIFSFLAKYGEARTKHDTVMVTGPCGSACTFLFYYWNAEDICYTPAARFGFHAARYGGGQIAVKETEMMLEMYPDWLRALLDTKGVNAAGNYGMDGPYGMQWFTGKELGLRTC